MKIFKILFVVCFLPLCFTACSDDDFDPSIFDTEDPLDEDSETYEFDLWLRNEYQKPYNLEFRYKMTDVSSDMGFNLVPARYEKSVEMAQLIKYLWFDAYNTIAGENFLKENGPRIIQLIGSAAYNSVSQTRVLGTAEGGILVTLYDCNSLERTNISQMNEYYFNTMHHEFAHILHQKKAYPVVFEDISKGNYAPLGWQNRSADAAAKLGFVSKYAGSQPREDFVEVISNYLVKSDSEWEAILAKAADPSVEMDGRAIILSKLEICATWLKDAWSIDIHELHREIQKRQENVGDLYK